MGDATQLIPRILQARTPYDVLGVQRQASMNDIRRQYIKLSRFIHPDKCNLPKAKEAFQILSNAYHTLADPSLRMRYDQTGQSGGSESDKPFSVIIDQLLEEFWVGNFTNILMLVDILNANNPELHLEKETIAKFLEVTRNTVTEMGEYVKIVRADTIKLWELRCELRELPWLDLLGAVHIGVRALKVPITVMLSVDSHRPFMWLFISVFLHLWLNILNWFDVNLGLTRVQLRPVWAVAERLFALPLMVWTIATALFLLLWRLFQVPLALGRTVGVLSNDLS